jgi:ribosome-associated translation inhibitor RaiA
MQIPVQVTFRDLPVDDLMEAECLREAAKLERYYDRITSCRVVVAQPHRNHRTGNQFDVRIDLTVPGAEIVINREPPQNHRDEEWQVAVHEAFDRARRRLEDHVHKMRGEVKNHERGTR